MKKIIGNNYLHTHPKYEKKLRVDSKHCIVDRKELEEIQQVFINNPDLIKLIGKNPWKIRKASIINST